MPATIAGSHLGPDIHANRPAANAAGQPVGAFYSCTTHGLIYKTDGSTWSTYATLGGSPSGSITASGYTQATAKILGRSTASTGAIEEITVGSGLSLSAGSLTATGGGGSDLVQTYSGAGSVYVPGLRGSPDALPASPNASDLEFESLTGTTYGTLDTVNVTDFASHLHMKRVLGAASIAGRFWAIPGGGMPFTLTAKLSAAILRANNQFAGLMVLEASPGKATTFAGVRNGASNLTCAMYRWTTATAFASSVNGTSFSSLIEAGQVLFPYLRIIVASSTDVTMNVSANGYDWLTCGVSNQNPSLTIANFGLVIGDVAGASTVEAVIDWARIT